MKRFERKARIAADPQVAWTGQLKGLGGGFGSMSFSDGVLHRKMVPFAMALNIKDSETEGLAAELADRLNTSKTGAIRSALRTQLALVESRSHDRLQEVLEVLRTEIWPLTTPSDPITKQEREEILGYSDKGV